MSGEFYKMDFEAWDEGTDALSLELEGAYLRLCHQLYRRKARIPAEPATLARIWRVHPNKARKLLADLIAAGKVIEKEGHLTNTRVTRELHNRETRRTQQADAGHTGGTRAQEIRRNALKNNDADEANSKPADKRNQAEKEIEREIEIEVEKKEPPKAPSDEAAEQPALFEDQGKVTPLKRPGPSAAEIQAAFEEFWRAYPRREGSNPKKPTFEKFVRAVRDGADPRAIIAGARAYAAMLHRTGKANTGYVAQAVRWLNQQQWLDDYEPHAPPERKYHMV